MPRAAAFFCVLAATGACSSGPHGLPPDAMRKLVQDDVRLIQQALYGGDVDTLLAYTHPKILERIGKGGDAKAGMQAIAQQMRSRNMKLGSLTFPGPPDMVPVGERLFAIVPTLTVFSARDERIESLNYQVGVLEPDASSWKYVAGSTTSVREYFPDFPATYQFPKTYRKRL